LIDLLHQAPPVKSEANELRPVRWTLQTIRDNLAALANYTLSGVWYYLKRARVIWRSARLRQWSPDPEYQSKLEHLCACLGEAGFSPGEIELIFMDEAGFYRWPVAARTWSEAAPVLPPCTYHTGNDNNSQWRLIGGLNAYTGQVNYLSNYIVGRRQVIAWYQQLNQAYPKARKIYIAQDNWSIHSHPEVLEALMQFPHIEIVWLPTYSPWLNPIEKLWRWLKVDTLKMHRLSQDWKELKHQVDLFLAQFTFGSRQLLQYVGLLGEGKLAQALHC
jgi:putative transposase